MNTVNSIDTRKMAQGILYNFNLQRACTNSQVDALVQIKDIARKNNLSITANKYGQIEIVDIDTRAERARTFAI